MSIKSKKLDFTGQTFNIGIDAHKSNWKVTIINNGIELKTFSTPPSPDTLAKYLKKNYPNGTYQSVYEAGFCGFWIHRKLNMNNINNIIVNPADVPTTNKERHHKSDQIDSRKLSRELENNSLKGIFVPDEYEESLRCLHRLFHQTSKRLTQIKNRIKAFLHFTGVTLPTNLTSTSWSNPFICYLESVKFKTDIHKLILDKHIKEFRHTRNEKLLLLREIRKIVKENETIKLLRTVPGIGPLTSFSIYAELVDINRFKNFDHLASYVGLIPTVQSSDETIIVKGISYRHCKYLRTPLIQSVWIAIRKDPALLQAYNSLTRRMVSQKAIIRIAKKLLNRIRYVWLNKKEYVIAVLE